MGKPVSKPLKPYITTIDKGKVEANEVKVVDTSIIADNQSYSKKKIIAYSDGTTEYASISEPVTDFARKVYSGRIDVYQYVLHITIITPTNEPGGAHRIDNLKSNIMYMCTPASPAVMLINYKDLKQIIPADHPANEWLAKYKQAEKTQHKFRRSYAGVIAVGLLGLAINSQKNDPTINAISGSLTGLGCIGWVAVGINQEKNKFNLQRAIAVYNGVDFIAKP